jgi:hypothetical protein
VQQCQAALNAARLARNLCTQGSIQKFFWICWIAFEICAIIDGFADEKRFVPHQPTKGRNNKIFDNTLESVLQCKASLIAAGQAR